MPIRPHRRRGQRRGAVALASTLMLGAGLLSACASGAKADAVIWYINPDSGGQAALAARCSQGKPYTIETQVLPQDATQQRIQLIRRLAAKDDGIDLMSIDPAFTAEFANAGYLSPLSAELTATLKGTQQSFAGAIAASSYDQHLVVAPFWSNTQVLWYRKSWAAKTGLDLSQPVTWDQIIQAASTTKESNGAPGTVAVQANKYEAYTVLINALIEGAGGDIASDLTKGEDASIDIDSDAGRDAARIIHELATSPAAPPDLSVSTEGTAASTFAGATGGFMTNWTFIWHNYDSTAPDLKKDIGYTRYPRTVASMPSRPPYGGIGLGISKYSTHQAWDQEAVACLTSPTSQGIDAVMTGNMPAGPAGYDYAPLKKLYPADLLQLFQDSVNDAAPRPVSPYWSDMSGAIQSTWHPPASVSSDTPAASAKFIDQVLHGKKLL